jgi:GNAT superfamily N-acetyltransferase
MAAARRETRRNSPERPALRIRIPRRTNSNSSSSESAEPLYFDKSLRIWNRIASDFAADRTADYFVYMFYDPTYGRARSQGIDDVIPSRAVMKWAGSNYSSLIEFCSDEIDEDRAYMRYAGGDAKPEYESALLLAIRHDGRILGFASVDGWDSSFPYLNDICVAKKRRGIGRKIIDAYMRYAKANGAEVFALSAVTSAILFYRRLGFVFNSEPNKDQSYDQYDMYVPVADYRLANAD